MMELTFEQLQQMLVQHFEQMTANDETLFFVDINVDELWELYLDSFADGDNVVHAGMERREYDCSACRNFIKRMGKVVTVSNGQLQSVWDFETGTEKFDVVLRALSAFVKQHPIANVFLTTDRVVGTKSNRGQLPSGRVVTWNHFYLNVPSYAHRRDGTRANADQSTYRGNKNVLQRSLTELTRDAIETVLELIAQGSLYRGEQWQKKLQQLLALHVEHSESSEEQRELLCWVAATGNHKHISRIRNESMGTLLVDLSSGVELEEAVRRYEHVVAPHNYQRPKPIFTKAMLEKARQTVAELGLMPSLARRFATIDDLSARHVLFMNIDTAFERTTPHTTFSTDSFSVIEKKAITKPRKFHRVEEVHVDKFVSDILPHASKVELYYEHRHAPNLMTLTTAVNEDVPSLFWWGNPYAWNYRGNMADSAMKRNVANAGGKTDGVLRFSIQWNTPDRRSNNDFDAHCHEPNGNHIYYPNSGQRHNSSGTLDVDIVEPDVDKRIVNGVAVENIVWTDLSKMPDGEYTMLVHNFSFFSNRKGFTAEVEFNGVVHEFDYPHDVKSRGKVPVATVTLKDGQFSIDAHTKFNVQEQEAWGLSPGNFYDVSCATLSPNYWSNDAGHKHYFFFLPDAVCEEPPRGIFNEFLHGDLRPHRRVFESLGSEMQVSPATSQLTGLGFTHNQHVLCRVTGRTERTIKVTF